jgi:DNA polymerase-3 subunit epsilon
MSTEYAVIDVETTGGFGTKNRITEIAIFITDGEKIIDEFISLVNPEVNIPAPITALTGIDNEMVADAPKFYEIGKKVWEITENRIFIAHNVSFDYNVIRQEYKLLGARYERKKACTVRMSRKSFPGQRSYSLGKLCNALGIQLEDRHRAYGDAKATVTLLHKILVQNQEIVKADVLALGRKAFWPSQLDVSILEKLPEDEGVYFFHNADNEIVYVGKANNIKSRILGHFSTTDSGTRKNNMVREIADITFERMGSELVSLLYESYLIKKLQPKFNRAQRKPLNKAYILTYTDQKGFIRPIIDRNKRNARFALLGFSSTIDARNHLHKMAKQYNLCHHILGLSSGTGPCFEYQIKNCQGACVGDELPDSHNKRLMEAFEMADDEIRDYYIQLPGRTSTEYAVVWVENGVYKGFGFFDESVELNVSEVRECIDQYPDDRDVQKILRSFIRKNPSKVQSIHIDLI